MSYHRNARVMSASAKANHKGFGENLVLLSYLKVSYDTS